MVSGAGKHQQADEIDIFRLTDPADAELFKQRQQRDNILAQPRGARINSAAGWMIAKTYGV